MKLAKQHVYNNGQDEKCTDRLIVFWAHCGTLAQGSASNDWAHSTITALIDVTWTSWICTQTKVHSFLQSKEKRKTLYVAPRHVQCTQFKSMIMPDQKRGLKWHHVSSCSGFSHCSIEFRSFFPSSDPSLQVFSTLLLAGLLQSLRLSLNTCTMQHL